METSTLVDRLPPPASGNRDRASCGDVAIGVLAGARETKVRPAVVIASATYLAERPDVLVGILTTKVPNPPGTTDDILLDWRSAGLRAESFFRAYVLTAHRSELNVIGDLSARDWDSVKACVRAAFAS